MTTAALPKPVQIDDSHVQRAAVYARMSKKEKKLDERGRAAGVAVDEAESLGARRQIKACREKAAELGWTVGSVYIDDGLSASTDAKRKQFQRMLDDARSRDVDAIIAWDLDRLTRKPVEIEQFIGMADTLGLPLAAVTGVYDLATANGRLFARLKGAVARFEV